MKREKTNRGFTLYTFTDYFNEPCSLQDSSIATEFLVWLGTDNSVNGTHPITGADLTGRMHIDQKTAKQLIKKLTFFVENGCLP